MGTEGAEMSRPGKGGLPLAIGVATLLAGGCLEGERLLPELQHIPDEALAITVTAPNGGEAWRAGRTYAITWQSEGAVGAVDITLLHAGQVCAVLADSIPNTGAFEWPCTRCGEDSLGYQIRVADAVSGLLDVSDLPFAVAIVDQVCTIEVTAPAGDGTWMVGDVMPIAWERYGSCGGLAVIELVQDLMPCSYVAEVTANDGRFDWVVHTCSLNPYGYRIRVTDLDSGSYDESDGSLTILSGPPDPCQVGVLAPNGGEEWIEGLAYAITWERTTTCGQTVDIELVNEGQSLREMIAAGAPNNGRYTWVAERLQEIGGGYRVRVTDVQTGNWDESDEEFSIATLPPCELTVTCPNGGEIWATGESYLIGWEPTGACGSQVAIELLQAGTPCQVISAGAPNTGTYLWTATQCGLQTSDYAIRVSDLASGASDASDGTLSIYESCTMNVVEPHGGQTMVAGTPVLITWLRNGACDGPVCIDLLQAGVVCRTIAATLPNSGSHVWIAERCGAASAGYRVRITDLASGRTAESGGTFTIEAACTLRIYQPNGGETWIVGRVETIHWLRTGACSGQVVIDLLRDGVLCETLAAAAPNTGSFTWEARQVGGRSAGYRIRITDPASGATCQSYGPFSIQEPCQLELLWPDGGEMLVSGHNEFITWDASATCGGNVRIELLRGTERCRTIVASTANDGSQAWDPQPCGESGSDYRIVLTDLVSLAADTSAAPFEIRAPVYLRFSAESGTWATSTNNPGWVDQVELEFDAAGTHSVAAPVWLPGGGMALIVDPDEDGTASFFPARVSGAWAHQGLDVDRQCCGVEVRLTGCSHGTGTLLGLTISTDVSGDCLVALPVTTDLREMRAQLGAACVRSGSVARIETAFTDRDVWNRLYAVRAVEYVFLGWPAP